MATTSGSLDPSIPAPGAAAAVQRVVVQDLVILQLEECLFHSSLFLMFEVCNLHECPFFLVTTVKLSKKSNGFH